MAYQVIGDGPVDVVNFLELVFHLDLCWTDPDFHHVLRARSQLLEDGVSSNAAASACPTASPTSPTVEQQADDVLAWMRGMAALVGSWTPSGWIEQR